MSGYCIKDLWAIFTIPAFLIPGGFLNININFQFFKFYCYNENRENDIPDK
jgi:hypothetical protein